MSRTVCYHFPMKTIHQTYFINAPRESVWAALTDPKLITKWGGGPTTMDGNLHTAFSLWGGDIHGTNIEVEENERLVQDWYGGKWDKPSELTIVLTEKDGGTQVELTHKNVPEKEIEDIEEGWKEYYMEPLKELVENL